MVSESHLDLKMVITFLKDFQSTDWVDFELEDGERAWRKDEFRCYLQWQKGDVYDTGARQFLAFARQDLEEDSERGRVNALRNATTAIRCRVDEFLTLSNFRGFSSHERWSLPYKMQVIQTFGIPAPNILRRLITSPRNLLEHEYIRPKDQQEIRDVVDIAELFLKATDSYVERGYINWCRVVSISWFKPGAIALTGWFPEAIGPPEAWPPTVRKKFEYHDGMCDEYELSFDQKKETVTLSYRQKELYRKCDRKTGEVRELKERVIRDEGPVNISVRDCAKEDVRELMILLREKGDEGL